MDAATKRRIFEPFFTTKAPGRGTGMGLATVAAIVRNCGGFIEVDSEPGRGTSMQVFLPRAAETLVTQTVDAAPADCPTGTETIVVVDEDETIRTLVRRIIQVRGYHVLEAVDGGDCLRVVRELAHSVSLVLTNVAMPGMGGRELAQQLRRISPETRIMFLVDCTEERQAAGVAGAVLQKPFTSDGLARKIRAVLDAHPTP
jgi:CheY-like chemotaxis protein